MSSKLLSHHDYLVLLSTVEDIYKCQHVELFPAHILSTIKKAILCDLISYNAINPERTRITSVSDPVEATISPEIQMILQQYLHEHPVVEYCVRTGDGRSNVLSDFLTQRQFHDLGLYSEFYGPLGIEYQMMTSIIEWRQNLMGIALSRCLADFSEKERLMLDLLRPHLVQAYQNVHAIDITRSNMRESVKEFVIVDYSDRVQICSERVWNILGKYFGFLRSYVALPAELNDWLAGERANLGQESDIPRTLSPFHAYNGKNVLTVHLLWGGKHAGPDVLLFEEESVEYDTNVAVSELTPREVEILKLISKGKTNGEISQILAISERTVKKHLEHIYRKMGVRTRGAAIARFLNI